MPDARTIARKLARPLARVPNAETACRDVMNGAITPEVWADVLKAGLPKAYAALDNGDLHGHLATRFIQPMMQVRAADFPSSSWAAIYEILSRALRDDARVAFLSMVPPVLDEVAVRMPAIRNGDDDALDEAVARLTPLFDHRQLARLVDKTPAFDAALAGIDASPPPVPQEPPPPARDPMPDLRKGLSRVAALFGALTGRDDIRKQAQDLSDKPDAGLAAGLMAALGEFSSRVGGSAAAPPVLACHGAPVLDAHIVADGVKVPLSPVSVRAVAVQGDTVYAGLHDGRVVLLSI